MGYAGCLPLLLCQELNTVRAIKADSAARHKIRAAEEAAAQVRAEAAKAAERKAKEEALAARRAANAKLPQQQAMGVAPETVVVAVVADSSAGVGAST